MELPSLKDDTVLYNIYPVIPSSESLATLAIAYNKDIQRLCGSHIWYYEPLKLSERKNGDMQCLTGMACFRECVDDEWLIVHILLELTKLHPHLVISVEDNDGQFMLIEAANVIPRWLKPDNAANRVFMYQGAVHIIGTPATPSDVGVVPVGTPTLQQAVMCIRIVPDKTIASDEVQRVILKRVETSSVHLHSTHCLVPIPAAHILNTHTQLISSIVHAFCDRDKEDMKVVSQLKDFSPKTNEMIVSTVTFPRLLYAKLCHQQWNIPTQYSSGISSHQCKTALLGMKLTYGLEILSRCYSGQAPKSSDHMDWSKFVSSLSEKGYFKGELEGSELYRELLADAKEYYYNNMEHNYMSVLHEAGQIVSEQLNLKPWVDDHQYSTDTPLPPADDESWLTMTQDDLDSMLNNSRSSDSMPPPHAQSQSHSAPNTSSLELEEMAYGMKSFVDTVSSVDGAEFPWSPETASSGGEVKLDPNSFVSTLQNLIDKLGSMSNEGSDDEGSDDDFSGSETSSEHDEEMLKVMDQLNQELSTFTNLHQSCHHGDEVPPTTANEPLDIDYNVVANLLESYSGQEGGAGPASNIMNSLGIKFPQQT